MSTPWTWAARFGGFWYRFVVGDDWAGAAGVAALVAGTYGLRQTGIPAFWFAPIVIVVTVGVILRRALARRTAARCAPDPESRTPD